jgi:hypothetical protein
MDSKTHLTAFLKLAAAGFLFSMVAACAEGPAPGVPVRAVMSRRAHFERYRTFSCDLVDHAARESAESPSSLDVENRLRQVVELTLARKGYIEAGSEADIRVRVGVETAQVPDPYMQNCSIDDSCYDPTPWLLHLSIAVDVYARDTGDHVWRGATEVTPEQLAFGDTELANVVTSILAKFPRRVSTSEL